MVPMQSSPIHFRFPVDGIVAFDHSIANFVQNEVILKDENLLEQAKTYDSFDSMFFPNASHALLFSPFPEFEYRDSTQILIQFDRYYRVSFPPFALDFDTNDQRNMYLVSDFKAETLRIAGWLGLVRDFFSDRLDFYLFVSPFDSKAFYVKINMYKIESYFLCSGYIQL